MNSLPPASRRLRVAFLGSDPIALLFLEWMARDVQSGIELVGVFTQPDRPSGRGQQLAANAIKTWAIGLGLPVHQPQKVDEASQRVLETWQPDVSLVMAYGHILRDAFIGVPRLGTLNLHTSILPRFRGASPIQTAIAAGEVKTGVTLMRIVRALDAGPVADVETTLIGPDDTAYEVEQRLAACSVHLLQRNLPRLAAGTLVFTEQAHGLATYCRRLLKSDGVLDFTAEAADVAARINGLYPWPACSVDLGGIQVKLGLAQVDTSTPDHGGRAQPPGSVVLAAGGAVRVICGRGSVRLRRLQRPGGRMLSAEEFLRGFRVPEGWVIPSVPMPALVSSVPFSHKPLDP